MEKTYRGAADTNNTAADLDDLVSAWRSLSPERRTYYSTQTQFHMHKKSIGWFIAVAVVSLGFGAYLAGLQPGLIIALVLFGVLIGVLLTWAINGNHK